MGILFGLLAALGWGGGDFLISRVTRRAGVLQTMLYVQLAGLAAIGLVLLARRDLPPADPIVWGIAIGVNLFNLGGTLLLYRAFAVGTLAIVSPIAASFAAVSTALAILGGERPGGLALGGAALVIAGVMVVSRGPRGAAGPPQGILAAVGAALCLGVYFWALSRVTPLIGIAWPVLVGRLTAIVAALGLMAARGRRPAILPASLWPYALGAAALDTIAFLAYNAGIVGAYVSVVAALASIFSAVTVLLAWVFLHERLSRSQWLGVAGLLVGVLLVSI
jgi:drug/metabolite transporter (DMT)-like permease